MPAIPYSLEGTTTGPTDQSLTWTSMVIPELRTALVVARVFAIASGGNGQWVTGISCTFSRASGGALTKGVQIVHFSDDPDSHGSSGRAAATFSATGDHEIRLTCTGNTNNFSWGAAVSLVIANAG